MTPGRTGDRIVVDRAGADDRPELTRLLGEYFAELSLTFEAKLDYDIADPLAGYADGAMLVVRRGRSLIGCLGLRPLAELGSETGEIKRMYLAPSARGGGWGRRLLEEAIAAARSMGLKRIVLDTMSRLTAANRLYGEYGFRDIPRYNDNHRSDRFMELFID